MCDARKYGNVGFAFVGNGGDEVGRFIASAAINEVEALNAAHFFDFGAVYSDQGHRLFYVYSKRCLEWFEARYQKEHTDL